MNQIRVYVIDFNRKFFYLRWTDPLTGDVKTQSSKCKARGPAERKAADKEKELNAAAPQGDGSKPWKEFVSDYLHQSLSGSDHATEKWHTAKLNVFEATMTPRSLSDVTAACLSQYVGKMRALKRSEETVRGHLVAIRCALKWALDQGLISHTPPFPKSREIKKRKAKGRDLTFWEFVRMLRAVPLVVEPQQVESWRHLLIGLWLSGLRIGEAVALSWDDPTAPRINLAGKFPLLEIDAEDDKGREHRLMPLTPDFARWVLRGARRSGRVFQPLGEKELPTINETNVSRTISAIGQRAGIIVDHRRKKYASAHDLRRTFGTRWSKRVQPVELKEMMRHRDIQTTMAYYVGQNAQSLAQSLWDKVTPKVTVTSEKSTDSTK